MGISKIGTVASSARLPFVLKVPLRHLRPKIIYSIPCDRTLQRAYYGFKEPGEFSIQPLNLEMGTDGAQNSQKINFLTNVDIFEFPQSDKFHPI